MKDVIITKVKAEMLAHLSPAQMEKLHAALVSAIMEAEGSADKDDGVDMQNMRLISAFSAAKRVEGCSEKTLSYYESVITRMASESSEPLCRITTDNIRCYLANYQKERDSSKVTIDNMRRIFSSFFAWLEDEDYIMKSPVRRIRKIKCVQTVKETFSDECLELLRDACTEPRDLALIDLLISTGMRVGELVQLNRDDIDFDERQCVVLGKGDKEREVYFDARAKLHLKRYLEGRTDNESALFVSLRAPFSRMRTGGVEARIRAIGELAQGQHAYPHKFRRTMATAAIDKGMPIEQVQRLLGHTKIDTTMHYVMVKQANVKLAHRKYVG